MSEALPTVGAVLVAAGDGVRLAAGRPKAFCEVAGSTLLEHAASRLRGVDRVTTTVVVAHPTALELARSLLPATVVVVPGGATRQQSVAAGLEALPPVDFVLVHDVARAFVPPEVVVRVIGALDNGADAVVPVVPVVDTLTAVDDDGAVLGTVDRGPLRAVQTPQGFRLAALVAAHEAAAAAGVEHTDDASVVERHGGTVVAVEGSDLAFKVTRPFDLALADVVARS